MFKLGVAPVPGGGFAARWRLRLILLDLQAQRPSPVSQGLRLGGGFRPPAMVPVPEP